MFFSAQSFKLSFFILAVLLVVCFVAPSKAEDPEHDLQFWPVTILEIPLTEEKLSLYTETIPFLVDQASELSRIQLRGALVYKATPQVSLWAGGDYFAGLSEDATKEARLWQQVRFTKKHKRLTADARFRLEERYLIESKNVAVRNRNRLKLSYGLGKKQKNYLTAADEIFFNLNDVGNSIEAGLGENRIYAGVGRKINDYVSLELGYMLSYALRARRPDFVRHIIRLETNIKLPYFRK
jgi:hypothetical protein